MDGRYIKLLGIQFDALSGLTVVADYNTKDFAEAGILAQKKSDHNTIFIGIPCECTLKKKTTLT